MSTNHSIAVYFKAPEAMGYPFNQDYYFKAYQEFNDYCTKSGIKLYIVRDKSYLGHMRFSNGWTFTNGILEEVPEPIQVEMVIVKSITDNLWQEPGDIFLNNLELDVLANSKWQTYQAIGEHMAKTQLITEENWQEVLKSIRTERVVLKPVHGEEGKGIIITEAATCDFPALQLNQPYLAQEFIDGSKGIPGITNGIHDLRLIAFNGEIKLSFVRIPKPGNLLSNLAQGGSLRILSLDEIPSRALAIAKSVDEKFKKFGPRMYTVDFMFDGEQPYVVEVNPQPGFPYDMHGEEFRHQFFTSLLDVVKSALK